MIGSDGYTSPWSHSPVSHYPLVSLGRWVFSYDESSKLLKRPITPHYGKPLDDATSLHYIEPLLHQICGQNDIRNLIFIVAPTSKANFHRYLHCFDRNTWRHLGSSFITMTELEFIKQFQMLLKYELVYTDEQIPLKQLACNPSVVRQIIMDGKAEILREEVEEPLEPAIKSLRNPKIPVRLRNVDVIQQRKRLNIPDEIPNEAVWKI